MYRSLSWPRFHQVFCPHEQELDIQGIDNKPAKQVLPWVDFLEEQRTTFGAVYSTLTNTNDDRSFESQAFLRGLGARVSRRAISNEKDLEHFQHNSVEDPVRSIVQCLTEEEAFRHEFDVGDGIIFENHPSAISDVAEEVVERQGPPVTPPRTPGPARPQPASSRPDLRLYGRRAVVSAEHGVRYGV